MAAQPEWTYESAASPGDADGRKCVFCGQVISRESQPGRWALKPPENFEDADFPVEHGYAHRACTEERLARSRKSRFTLPDVPGGPGGR